MSISPTCVDNGCGCLKKPIKDGAYAGIDIAAKQIQRCTNLIFRTLTS
jgi:hypothetical protein